MSTTIEATYEGQVFRPTNLVPLAPNTTERLTIEALIPETAEPVAQSYPEAFAVVSGLRHSGIR